MGYYDEGAERHAAFAQEDIDRLEAQLRAARKVVAAGKRHAKAKAISEGYDAMMKCPVCEPFLNQVESLEGLDHTCGLSARERIDTRKIGWVTAYDRQEAAAAKVEAAWNQYMEDYR